MTVENTAPETAPTTEVAPTTTPEVEAPRVKNPILSARSQLREKLSKSAEAVFAKPTPTPNVAEPAATPPETVQEAVAAVEEATGEEAPKQKVGESDKKYATRLAQLTMQLQRLEADNVREKTSRETVEKERDALKATLDEASKDVRKALKLAGSDPVAVAQMMADGKLTAEDVAEKLDLPDDVKAKLERLEKIAKAAEEKEAAEKAAAEQAAADEQAAKARGEDVKVLQGLVDANAETYPLIKSIPNAADRLVNIFYHVHETTGELPEYDAVAKQFQTTVAQEAIALVSDSPTFQFLLSQKPELKDFLLKELGVKVAAPAKPVEEPTEEAPVAKPTITNKLAQAANKGGKISAAERKARMNNAAKSIFGE